MGFLYAARGGPLTPFDSYATAFPLNEISVDIHQLTLPVSYVLTKQYICKKTYWTTKLISIIVKPINSVWWTIVEIM